MTRPKPGMRTATVPWEDTAMPRGSGACAWAMLASPHTARDSTALRTLALMRGTLQAVWARVIMRCGGRHRVGRADLEAARVVRRAAGRVEVIRERGRVFRGSTEAEADVGAVVDEVAVLEDRLGRVRHDAVRH